MESAHIGLLLYTSSPKTRPLALSIKNTLHLDLINLHNVQSLKTFFDSNTPQGWIFSGIPSSNQALDLIAWSKESGFNLKVFNFENDSIETNKKFNDYSKNKIPIFNFDTATHFDQLSSSVFIKISELCFEEPGLVEKYFYFREIVNRLKIRHLIISGACSYIYYGKRSLKDIDVLVPSKEDLEKISNAAGGAVIKSDGSKASMYYLNLREIDVNSEVVVRWQEGRKQKEVPFNFNNLYKDSKSINFLGINCPVASPEDTVLFKLCLGRLGIDDFNDYKDDYEDVRGLVISQPINWNILHRKAQDLNVLERVFKGEKILKIRV